MEEEERERYTVRERGGEKVRGESEVMETEGKGTESEKKWTNQTSACPTTLREPSERLKPQQKVVFENMYKSQDRELPGFYYPPTHSRCWLRHVFGCSPDRRKLNREIGGRYTPTASATAYSI